MLLHYNSALEMRQKSAVLRKEEYPTCTTWKKQPFHLGLLGH